ncbi:MAG: CPBP family intramembrane metalloprotease [Saprospiraceae bacterium]|nr:CPBP family intramembrane metalloprotease [Saprospiraceae bacterium]
MPSTWSDYRHFIFLAFAAGICEEIIFRGFMVNYVLEMTSATSFAVPLALIVPAFIFAISHIYQGWLSVVKIASISLLFGALYMYTSSLYLVIIIHTVVDLVSGAVLVGVSRSK